MKTPQILESAAELYARQNPDMSTAAAATVKAAKQAQQQAEREQQQRDSLNRAETGKSRANYPAIFDGFEAKGIPAADIQPRVNVFTYNAWQAKGRQVRRGEKSVHVVTWIPSDDTPEATKRPVKSCVFHISQTDPVAA
jgi:hypothetical protein